MRKYYDYYDYLLRGKLTPEEEKELAQMVREIKEWVKKSKIKIILSDRGDKQHVN